MEFKHKRTVEHQLVVRYLNARCCGRTYNSRSEYEEHRLSLVHLRKIMEADKAKEEKSETQEGTEEGEGEGQEDKNESKEDSTVVQEGTISTDATVAVVNILSQRQDGEDPYTAETMPVYDPAVPIGHRFVSHKTQLHCRLCSRHFQASGKSLSQHCRSESHYNAIVENMKQEEAIKRREAAEQRAKEEEEKKKKEKKEKEEAEEEEEEEEANGDNEDLDQGEEQEEEQHDDEEE